MRYRSYIKRFAPLFLVWILLLTFGQNCAPLKSNSSKMASTETPSNGGSNSAPTGYVPPQLKYMDTFNKIMNDYGRKFCNEQEIRDDVLPTPRVPDRGSWYYDGTWVYQNFATFTKDPSWLTCADYVANTYRTWVNSLTLINDDYRPLGGWRLFPIGLYRHHLRTNQDEDKQAILRMATKSAFMSSWTNSLEWLVPCSASREVAYLLNSKIIAREFGYDPGDHVEVLTNYALGHLDQWFVQKTCISATDVNLIMQPIMAALTFEALTLAYEKTSDSKVREKILSKVLVSLDELWKMAWNAQRRSMIARTDQPTEYWATINVMLAANYAWAWQLTGDMKQLERADLLWEGAMTMDFANEIWGGKPFNQVYRRAFDFFKWRNAPAKTYLVPTKY